MLWQLKKLSTGETLNEPQELPENWGPVFGLAGIEDRLGDLSWLGDAYQDMGWVCLGKSPKIPVSAEDVNATIAQMLNNTAWAVAVDNTDMTKAERAAWIDYRIALKNVPLQAGFPTSIVWPPEPA
jgi:hypothetical protein